MKATAPTKTTGLSLTQHRDTTELRRLFNTINRKYFDDTIAVDIQWAAPVGSVIVRNKVDSIEFLKNSAEEGRFELALQRIKEKDIAQAINLLNPLAQLGHNNSQLLLIHLLPTESFQRIALSETYNRNNTAENAVPAACYYPLQSMIVIHPYLHDKNAPQFVVKYLIYHECCHKLLGEQCYPSPHPPEFMRWEHQAPHREKAIDWLQKEGFPTMTDTSTDL